MVYNTRNFCSVIEVRSFQLIRLPPSPSPEDANSSSFWNVLFEFRTMDKPSNHVLYVLHCFHLSLVKTGTCIMVTML
jgi:hypothetical protein